jgi:O-antigen ligase
MIRRAWPAVALVVAVPILFDPNGFETYLPLKWLAVCALVPAGVAWTLWQQPTSPRRDRVVTRWTVAWAGLLIAFTASAGLGVEPLVGLIGGPKRNLGLVAWVLFAAAAWTGTRMARSGATDTVIRALVAASIPVSAYALLQTAGADPFHYAAGLDLGRSRSTFGNAAFLGAYLVLVLPVALDAATKSSGNRGWRWASGSAALLSFAALLSTRTRGAWVGALIALLIYGTARRRDIAVHIRAVALCAAVAGVATAAVFLASPLGGRAAAGFDLSRGTTHGRLVQWADTVRLIGRRPVLGWGPDTYGAVFPRVASPRFSRAAGELVVADRAQNVELDVASAGGIVGLLGWLAVVGVLALAGWRGVVAGGTAAALAAGVAAYVVQLQFGFPLADVDTLFWLLAGMLVGLVAAPISVGAAPRRLTVSITAAAVACIALTVWASREVVADRQLRTAANREAAGQLRAAYQGFGAAAATAPERVLFRQALVRFLRRAGTTG